jgi:cardiolipin synthase
VLNLPNLVTISRLLLVPVFAWVLWQQYHDLALLIFVVAGLSDAVDGYLARRFNQTSRFGAMLDPIADKAILITALILLTKLDLIPYWLALAVIGRDAIILLGAALYRLLAGRLEIVPTLLGKLHTLFAFLVLSGIGQCRRGGECLHMADVAV